MDTIMTSQVDKNRHSAYSRAAVRKQLEEAVGEAVISYDLNGDGEHMFSIEHPMFRSAETTARLNEVKDSEDEGDLARAVLGDDYDRFIDAGGTDQDVAHLMIIMNRDMQDRLSDGTPTRR